MSSTTHNLIIHVDATGVGFVTQQFTSLNSVIQRLSNTFSLIGTRINNQVQKPISSISDALDMALPNFTNINNEVMALGGRGKLLLNGVNKEMNSLVNSARGGARRFMGLGFSMLFMGMAMNRAITSFITSSISAYKMAGNEQSVFNVKTNELAAAWEFFKFSLIDALSQSTLFLTLIDYVINLINWFNELPEGTKKLIAISAGAAWVATKVAELGGQIGLMVLSIEMIKPGIFFKLAEAIGLTSIATLSWNAALLANPITWIIIAVVGLILLVGYLWTTFDSGKQVLSFFGGFAIWLFALIGDSMIEFVLLPLRILIKLLDLAIMASNALFGTDFRTISSRIPESLQPGMLTRKAESYLAGAEFFQEAKQQVEEKETFGQYSIRVATEIGTAIASSIGGELNKALQDNKAQVMTPNT